MQEAAGRIVYETLQNYGGTCIFGMEDPIHEFHVVDRAATKIVTFHHDRHGAIMAHGYAQATARPGVCAATFGPGASNLSTGRLEALKSSVPLIAWQHREYMSALESLTWPKPRPCPSS